MSESIVIMTIGPLLTIVPTIPPLFVGQPGAISFAASGAEGLLRWTLVSSDLPAEWDTALTITDGVASLETAEIVDPGTYSVRVRLSDATRVPVEQTYSVRVVALPIEVSGALDAWVVTVAIDDVLTLSGGTGVFVSATPISGALPAGASVTLDGAELQFGGSPTGSGAWAVTLRVTDSEGAILDIPLSGTVTALPIEITGGPLLDAEEGEAYSDTLTISGGVPPYSLGTVTGVPTGLSVDIDGSTIEITGTPAADESDDSPFSLSIEVEDAEEETEVYTQSFVVSVPWTPAALSVPPAIWLNDDSAVTDVSGACSQWNDISGNGYHFTQSTAGQRPTIVSAALNGRRVLDFDGSADRLVQNDAIARDLHRVAASTYFFGVARADASSTGPLLWVARGDSTASRADIRLHITGGRRLDTDSYFQAPNPSASVPSDWTIVVGVINYSGRTVVFHRDGQLLATTTGAWTAGGNTSNTRSEGLVIGAFLSGATLFDGRIAEVATGIGVPSTDEIDKLFGYLAHRWGLTANLPSDHPYKTVAP